MGTRSISAGKWAPAQHATPKIKGRVGGPGKKAGAPNANVTLGSWWWASPAILMVLAIHYVSTGIGAFYAFTDWTGIGDYHIIGFDDFSKILSDPKMVGALRNTLFLAFGFLILTSIFGLMLALSLNRGLKSRNVLRVLVFMPVVLSPLAVSYIWKFIFDFNGPLNGLLVMLGQPDLARSWLADPQLAIWTVLITMTWQNIGLVMVIYLAGLAGIPFEMEEAAVLDGASLWQRFRYDTIPQLQPSIAIASLLILLQGLRVFDQVLALTAGGPFGASETLATQVYKETFAFSNFGYGAALALLLTLIMLVFSIFQQYITRDRSKSGR